jgi:hypothetical protein
MTFFKVVADEDVSGKEVKLSDRIIMVLKLEDAYIGEYQYTPC